MQYTVTDRGIEVTSLSDFSLRDTLDCGQCFRFYENSDGSFSGIAFKKKLHLFLDKNTLVFRGISEYDFLTVWRDYFDLDLDYHNIKQELSKLSPVLKEACSFAPGIRVLSQEPFEALCSFILSQNNHIKRIKGIVDRLCTCFGSKIGEDAFSFPDPSALAGLSIDDLSELRSGFRAAYLLDAANKVASGEICLKTIKTLPLDQAREQLMTIRGVGPKVADCILLYGMHRLDAFPKDVWIKRVMACLFPGVSPEWFGPYAGVAQQYLFHYARMHPELLKQTS